VNLSPTYNVRNFSFKETKALQVVNYVNVFPENPRQLIRSQYRHRNKSNTCNVHLDSLPQWKATHLVPDVVIEATIKVVARYIQHSTVAALEWNNSCKVVTGNADILQCRHIYKICWKHARQTITRNIENS
jgi:hypothetical protein